MLQKYAFLVAATAAAAVLALGGCAPVFIDANFTSHELTPNKQADVVLVADLEVAGTQKVIGVAKGKVPSKSPKTAEMKRSLRAEALEAALASAPSGPDVLVGPGWHEVAKKLSRSKDSVTITVVGYPARYRNFRRDTASVYRKQPFTVKRLADGTAVIGYDRNRFKAELTGGDILEIKATRGNGAVEQVKNAPATLPQPTALPAETNGSAVGGAPATTTEKTGE